MTWSSDKIFASVRKKNNKRLVMEITIESTVKFAKVAWM